MRCKSFKIQKVSFWFIIAIAIVAANLSASDAEGAAGPRFVVERRGVSDGRPVVFIPGVASAAAPYSSNQQRTIDEGQYAELTDVDVRVIANSRHFIMLDQPDAFAIALNGVLTGDRGGRD